MADLLQQEKPNQNNIIELSPNIQDKIVDQVLIQAGGVGLGIVVAIVGALFIANWLGIKPAIEEWSKKQRIESDTLKSISDTLSQLMKDNQLHSNKCAEDNIKITKSIEGVDTKVTELREDFRDLRYEIRGNNRHSSSSRSSQSFNHSTPNDTY
ncbi:hypothetical protein NIES22_51010 [Calothrix brevissima NIES-22]|nr:hypothetical protein NIES22_51010 [Calothrix brevissima NIES-22]